MLGSILLAAAAAVTASTSAGEAAAPEATAPPTPRASRPVPTGSTQPLTTTPRPSIGFLSAGALRDRCEATAPALVSYCFAYITGVHDTVRAYETWLRVREFCPGYTSSQADLRRAFLGYLKANPSSASGEAASVIVLAFKDTFACTDPEKPKAKAEPASNAKRSATPLPSR